MAKLRSSKVYGSLDIYGGLDVKYNLTLSGINPIVTSTSTGILTLFNTSLTTISAFLSATNITIGATTAPAIINIGTGDTLGVPGGSIETKILNLGTGALSSDSATNINIGARYGTTTIHSNKIILGTAHPSPTTELEILGTTPTLSSPSNGTLNLFNENLTTINAFGTATNITMGSNAGTTDTTTIRNSIFTLSRATLFNINGANPTLASNQAGTLTLFNTSLTTIRAFNSATSIEIGVNTLATTISIGSGSTGADLTKTLNLGTGAGGSLSNTLINIGAQYGTTSILSNNVIFSSVITLTPRARSSGSASYFTINTPTDLTLATGAESIGTNFTAGTRQWATGNIATQRERVFGAPTYRFVGASTITTAINVDIADPIQGTNATLTNRWALRSGRTSVTDLVVGTSLALTDGTNSSSTITGCTTLAGGLGVAKDIYAANLFSTATGATINRLIYTGTSGALTALAAISGSLALVSNTNGLPVASSVSTIQLQYLASATGTTGNDATNLVFSTSPTFVTPNLGIPASGDLSNCTFPSLSVNTTGTASSVTKVVPVDTADNLVYATMGANDFFRIRVGGASNAGWAEIATAKDGTEPIYVRQYTGVFATATKTATLLDASGNTEFPGSLSATSLWDNGTRVSINTHTHLYAGSNSAGGAASSVAGALTINNGGAGSASGSTYNGSAGSNISISYNSIGAAPLASPVLTGIPTAPTAAVGTDTYQLATTEFVNDVIIAQASIFSMPRRIADFIWWRDSALTTFSFVIPTGAKRVVIAAAGAGGGGGGSVLAEAGQFSKGGGGGGSAYGIVCSLDNPTGTIAGSGGVGGAGGAGSNTTGTAGTAGTALIITQNGSSIINIPGGGGGGSGTRSINTAPSAGAAGSPSITSNVQYIESYQSASGGIGASANLGLAGQLSGGLGGLTGGVQSITGTVIAPLSGAAGLLNVIVTYLSHLDAFLSPMWMHNSNQMLWPLPNKNAQAYVSATTTGTRPSIGGAGGFSATGLSPFPAGSAGTSGFVYIWVD